MNSFLKKKGLEGLLLMTLQWDISKAIGEIVKESFSKVLDLFEYWSAEWGLPAP